ncbi:hypothetical protein HPB50_000736 [Hyalomma asiaticum]|uniref:Uncharacterized protein n=1 Tax=Hyalomma asiaticum TaxID=266040 RepID=A0ACB7SUM5_HYAAI|nr:hypothetical protein HPB50_000736 [Hyalomma asiaticum]
MVWDSGLPVPAAFSVYVGSSAGAALSSSMPVSQSRQECSWETGASTFSLSPVRRRASDDFPVVTGRLLYKKFSWCRGAVLRRLYDDCLLRITRLSASTFYTTPCRKHPMSGGNRHQPVLRRNWPSGQ